MKLRYLTNFDYDIDIEEEQLLEINGTGKTLLKLESLALEDVGMYLSQKFDLTKEFTDTGIFDITKQYNVADRVYLDGTSWTSSSVYNVDDIVLNNGNIYISATSIGPTMSFPVDNTYWNELGAQYDLFYIQYPAPLFNSLTFYNQGDVIFWKGFTYSCESPTQNLSLTTRNQYLYQNYVPNLNVAPDDKIANANHQYWLPGSTSSYIIPIGTLPTNTTYWTNGDNRVQVILNLVLDLVIYYLHRTIAPKNIPDLRKIAYKRACEMLEKIAEDEYNINLISIPNGKGDFFQWGGNTMDDNSW